MKITITCQASLFVLLIALQGCDRTPDAMPELSALTEVERPNCVLDVEAGKIKKCRPELGAGVTGVAGDLQIDGIRPARQWAPMVGIELTSADQQQIFRTTFAIQEYVLDADDKPAPAKTPFKGSAELWNNRELVWKQALGAEIQPATPFSFRVTWDANGDVAVTLGEYPDKTFELDFQVDGVAITGSGVMVSTSELRVFQK